MIYFGLRLLAVQVIRGLSVYYMGTWTFCAIAALPRPLPSPAAICSMGSLWRIASCRVGACSRVLNQGSCDIPDKLESPADHINMRILYLGSKAQYGGDSRNNGL